MISCNKHRGDQRSLRKNVEIIMSIETFDLKETVVENKFVGLWRLLKGYHLIYVIAIVSVGVAVPE